MKTISLRTAALAAPIVSLIALVNCAPDDPITTGSTAGTAGSSSTGTAGSVTTTTAGTDTGGSSSGGSGVGTSGSVSASGATVGGMSGSGGAAGGTMSGGASGSGGGGSDDPCKAGGDAAKCIDFVAGKTSDYGVYAWKSSWFVTGCANKQGHDCITVASCPNQGAANFEDKGGLTLETFELGGVPGQHYKVTFQFNALSEAKEYRNGTRDTGTTVPANAEAAIWDTFYRDGEPIPSNYNVMKLTVFDNNMMPARHYYMNSFPAGGGWESHRTFLVSYMKSIVVVGGGKITYLVQDSNCHAIDNCGAGNVPDDSCPAPRNLPGADAQTMLPAMYKDPADGKVKATASLNQLSNGSTAQPWHSQAGHFTITKIEETADPVTMNY